MAKINKAKELQKQLDERNLFLRRVDMGLIAIDVLQNKKMEYMESFLSTMSQEDNLKLKVIQETLDEVFKQLNEFDEKFILQGE